VLSILSAFIVHPVTERRARPNVHRGQAHPAPASSKNGARKFAMSDEDANMPDNDRAAVKTSFASIPVLQNGRQWFVGAELRVPDMAPGAEPRQLPAVIIVHGSAGLDSRGFAYSRRLNARGIATLEVDLWTARGVRTPAERPRSVVETLPDAFAALAYLANQEAFASSRIGIMGFSWGGVVTMLSATQRYSEIFAPTGLRFAAHAALYPVCWAYNTVPGYEFGELTGAPVFLQAGEEDRYDPPGAPMSLRRSPQTAGHDSVAVTVYAQATHAWDRQGPDIEVHDPSAFAGRGGLVPFVFNPAVAELSFRATCDFFVRHLK
jgi:dienelactone hydrolase